MLSVLLRSGDGRVVPTNQQEEIGMEATVEAPSAQTRKDYTSRRGALSRFFRMSRDGWKSKYKELKATVKGYKNRLAHLARSREQWRIRAERAGEQITILEVEIAELRARLAALGGGKKTRTRYTAKNSGLLPRNLRVSSRISGR
jgi:chromosome segregation ATPase